jgi:hypothetical protein
MVVLQVFPEQLAETEGQRAQGSVIERQLAFPQVVDQDVMDGPAGDLVLVDHLLDADLAPGVEDAHGREGGLREDSHSVQQLVEVHARVGRVIAGAEQPGQFQAVPGGDVADRTSLGRHHGRDPAQCAVLGVGIGGVVPAESSQGGEPLRVAAACHLNGQDLHGARREQPRQAGLDHIAGDQREHASAEGREVVLRNAVCPATGPQPFHRQVPPARIASRVRTAGDPAVLPGLSWTSLQPVQDLGQAGLAPELSTGGLGDERRCEQPLEHLVT